MDWLKSRALHHQKLFELHGKISMLSDQVERRFNKTSVTRSFQPLIVFNNGPLAGFVVSESLF